MRFLLQVKSKILQLTNKFLKFFGWSLKRDLPDYLIFDYASYDEYKATQTMWNEVKLERTWADPCVLDVIVAEVKNEFGNRSIFGICHGSRNGFEQNYLLDALRGKIIGTDISHTASQFPNSIVHDFHDAKEEWLSYADFIYSNSLDQSWNPKLALSVWVDQLRVGGLLFIEMSEAHSPRHASKMDPFGVKPEYFAYLLAKWLGHKVSIKVILTEKSKWKMPIWLYEIKRIF